MAEYQYAEHGFGPVYDSRSRLLILGSFPSVKSREEGFFYGHPRNRFWRVLSALLRTAEPHSAEEKRAMLLANQIAVYDVIESCRILGSSDSSIRDVVPADLSAIIHTSQIKAIFVNGKTAGKLYRKFQEPETGIPAVELPSTSPANAAVSLERLIQIWGQAFASCGMDSVPHMKNN